MNNGMRRQRYECNNCSEMLILVSKGFIGSRHRPEVITESMHLLMNGMSSGNVTTHIKLTYGVTVGHPSITRWVRKYGEFIQECVDTLLPKLSVVMSIDEMVLNVKETERLAKGFHMWLWGIIDPETCFLIATEISKKRSIKDAGRILRNGKRAAVVYPRYVISDSLAGYDDAIKKEFNRRITHIKTKAIRDGFTNLPIERWHNEFREKPKIRRGLGNDKSAQDFAEMYRLHHNLVRPHMGLDGKPRQRWQALTSVWEMTST